MNPLITIGIKAVRRAGNIIVRHLDRVDRFAVSQKGRNDFVSEVDRLAEEAIIDCIHRHYPDHAIVAEESGTRHSPGRNPARDAVEWIIDPLDGTTNFLHGHPSFSVSVGVRHHNRMEHGIVFDPLRNEIFHASRGSGAQLNDRRIRVSGQRRLSNSLVLSGFPSRHPGRFDDWMECFRQIFPRVSQSLHSGSAALDLAYVACGRGDAYWESGLDIWDMAAGSLIVREAGGLVTGFQGEQDHLATGCVLAASPGIFSDILGIVKSHFPENRPHP
ncbi:MAG: inositol monophosphatase family protein [Gammaproteobacteria bacterium]|nr:inositol monophosphatase family protein [Gammaproteobacteria bacterium]